MSSQAHLGIFEAAPKPKDSVVESIDRGFREVSHHVWDDTIAQAFGSKSLFRPDAQQKQPISDAKATEALALGFANTSKLYGDQAEANTFGKVLDQPWNLKKQLQHEAA